MNVTHFGETVKEGGRVELSQKGLKNRILHKRGKGGVKDTIGKKGDIDQCSRYEEGNGFLEIVYF